VSVPARRDSYGRAACRVQPAGFVRLAVTVVSGPPGRPYLAPAAVISIDGTDGGIWPQLGCSASVVAVMVGDGLRRRRGSAEEGFYRRDWPGTIWLSVWRAAGTLRQRMTLSVTGRRNSSNVWLPFALSRSRSWSTVAMGRVR
jgi:hypothetical protein